MQRQLFSDLQTSTLLKSLSLINSPHKMGSLETLQATSKPLEPISSPARISFSSEFLDENNFISICPNPNAGRERGPRNPDFEFLSGSSSNNLTTNMITADELFSEGKLLPFWQMHHIEKLNKITLKTEHNGEQARPEQTGPNNNKEESRVSWFLDDDPSPRPPKCTVLWKELLRLKKQRASTLSPSSSSSSSSSRSSIGENTTTTDERKEGISSKEKAMKRIKKGLERTRSASIRIRPMVNVPICTSQLKSSSLPPLFPLRKGR